MLNCASSWREGSGSFSRSINTLEVGLVSCGGLWARCRLGVCTRVLCRELLPSTEPAASQAVQATTERNIPRQEGFIYFFTFQTALQKCREAITQLICPPVGVLPSGGEENVQTWIGCKQAESFREGLGM